MKALWIVFACLLSLPVCAQSPPAGAPAGARSESEADPHAGIRAVIEAFRGAIIDKDKARFVGLFAPGAVAWQSVASDEDVERLRVEHPAAVKARFDPGNTHLSFIDGIVADPRRTEETFDRIRIDSDGDIASVVFDYRFLSGGVESNRGQEGWHLLRTDQGWRIISVIWSTQRAPAARP